MFSHIMVGSNDIARSKKFYDATLGALGVGPAITDPNGRLFYRMPTGVFCVTKPIDGHSATHATGSTIGFAAASGEQASAWHAARVANGGTAIEDPPAFAKAAWANSICLRGSQGGKLCAPPACRA